MDREEIVLRVQEIVGSAPVLRNGEWMLERPGQLNELHMSHPETGLEVGRLLVRLDAIDFGGAQ